MTIKAIKEAYANYGLYVVGGTNKFKVEYFGGEYGKCVIVVNYYLHCKDVVQVVRVSDGARLLVDGRARPCDNLEDAVDVASEMLNDNDEYVEVENTVENWNKAIKEVAEDITEYFKTTNVEPAQEETAAESEYEAQKREALNIIYRAAEGCYFLGLLWRDKYTYNEVCELVRQYNAKYAGDNPRNSDYVVIGETVGEDGVVNGFVVNGREYLYKY